MGRLDNKVCIITGASSGIGLATARRFAQEGGILVLFARREDRLNALKQELEEQYGSRVLVIPGDVSKYEDIVRCVDTTAETFGRIDVLINNAGIVDYHIPITRCTNEFWDKIIAVDMTSVFQFSREVLRYMEPAGKGSIVNVSSEAGYYGNCGFPYSAAKAAVIAMTKNIAIQFNETNIRCNCICPGTTPTELNCPEEMKKFHSDYARHCFKCKNEDCPPCDPEDQANAMLYFACDESKSTTGQALVVDHGEKL